MRNVVLGLSLSLDGHIARPNGVVDFLSMPKDYSMAPFFATVDTAIMGRKTLEAGLRMSGGKLPRTTMTMYVFSNSKPPASVMVLSSSTSRRPVSSVNCASVRAKTSG